jgi:hypothetical protein
MAMETMYYMALWQYTMAIYVLKKFQAYMKRGLVYRWMIVSQKEWHTSSNTMEFRLQTYIWHTSSNTMEFKL